MKRRSRPILLLVVAAALLGSGIQALPAAAVGGIDIQLPTGSRISGHVTDVDGTAIAGFEVTACTPTDTCLTSTATAADGSYTLRGLPPAEYVVRANPIDVSDFLSAFYATGGSVPTIEEATHIDVTGGDVNGIDIDIARGHRVSGTVTAPGGAGVAGIDISASGPGSGTATTDASGDYTIRGLAAGSYVLSVRASGTNFIDGPVADGTVGDGSGTPIDVAADVSDVDILLRTGYGLSGTLSGDLGAGVRMEAFGPDSRGTDVAADGSWSVGGLRPGGYQLVFVQAQLNPDESLFPLGYLTAAGTLDSDFNNAGSFEIVDADLGGLDAAVPQAPTLRGRVVGDDGPGLANAGISMCDDAVGCAAVRSAADGTFEFRFVPPGSYRLASGARDHINGFYGPGGFVEDAAQATIVQVRAADVSGIEIVLPRGDEITGRVTGPAGEPVEGSFVLPFEPGGGIHEFGPGPGITNAAGEYHARGLKPGEYVLRINPPENSDYFAGYYDASSPTGFTESFESATLVVVGDTAPTIVARNPADGATGVARNTRVEVTFSENVTGVNGSSFRLRDPRGRAYVAAVVTYDPATHTATLRPRGVLRQRHLYVVELSAAIVDGAGNPLAPTTWSFTTR